MKLFKSIRTGFVLWITMLCLSLSGCNRNGEASEEAQESGEETSEGAVDTSSPFEFEGTGDEFSGLTSDELLNLPIGDEQNPGFDSITANIPSGINVERENTVPTTVPAFDSSSVESIDPTPTPTAPPVTAKGISVSPEEIILYVDETQANYTGSSATVTATLYSGTGLVDWKSEDTSVALVNGNGTTATVNGISAGTTYITASIRGSDMSARAVVTVRGATPQSFEVAECLINKGGTYSASECDNIIAAVNQARAEYNIPACTKNTGLCKVADVRSKEISYAFMNVRPDGSPYTSVAPAYYKSEGIAVIPKGSSGASAVEGLKNYTTTRRDIMNENFRNIGASYYTWGDYTYVVVALGY